MNERARSLSLDHPCERLAKDLAENLAVKCGRRRPCPIHDHLALQTIQHFSGEGDDWLFDVHTFSVTMNLTVNPQPTVIEPDHCVKRMRRQAEELRELHQAMEANDLAGIAQEAVDVIVSVLSTTLAYGIDLRPVWPLVRKANMAKTPPEERDGKVVKPEGWKSPAPEITKEIARQLTRRHGHAYPLIEGPIVGRIEERRVRGEVSIDLPITGSGVVHIGVDRGREELHEIQEGECLLAVLPQDLKHPDVEPVKLMASPCLNCDRLVRQHRSLGANYVDATTYPHKPWTDRLGKACIRCGSPVASSHHIILTPEELQSIKFEKGARG